MSEPTIPRFFFIHVMKTGGTTFQQHLTNNFGADAVYPNKQLDLAEDKFLPYRDVGFLLKLDAARRAQIRAYFGHFPFFVTELMGVDLTTLAIVRDPVERTISYLKHCKRYHTQHKELSLEEIYEDPEFYPMFIENHQTKVFAMTAGDGLDSIMGVLKMDDRRLQAACDNLDKIDVLGLHEQYGEFLDEVRSRFGWRLDKVQNWFVAKEPWQVSDAFRRRIAADNAVDMAFYEHARNLHARRRARSGG